MRMKRIFWQAKRPGLVALLGGLLGFSALAAPLATGDSLPGFSARDQFGQEFNSTNGARFLLIATEMACAKAATQKLAAQGADFLTTNSAAYVMDIHAMPAMVRYFVVPRMRKYPERIVLVEAANSLKDLPAQPGRVTVLALTPGRRIQKISYWDPVREPAGDCFK